jgi:hypothetical protein
MNRILTQLFIIIASTVLVNQINAQTPVSFQTIESSPNAGGPADYSLVGLELSRQLLLEPKLKTAQTELELLDSIVYIESFEGIIYNGNKNEWGYDAEGNKTYYSWYFWNTVTESWMGIQRWDSIYNASDQLSMITIDNWNSETRRWKPGNKIELEYNAEGGLILYANYSWNNVAGDWECSSKTESTHSYTEDNSHIIFSITYNYNSETGEWTPHHRNEINYDSNGNRTLYNASLLDSASNTWVFKTGSFKYEDLYDEQGNQTLASYYIWDSKIDHWKGQGDLLESSYDSIGNETSQLIKNWDVSLNQWVNNSKSVILYNESGLLFKQITCSWDSLTGDWVAVYQLENSINEDGEITSIIESEWNNADSLWVIFSRQDIFYDTYENVILSTFYQLDEQSGDFIKTNDTEYIYNDSGDKLIEEASSYYYDGIPYVIKTNYYYSIHSVSSLNTDIYIETKNPLVYPNPFTDQLSFKLNNNNNNIRFVLELFNSAGQRVWSKCIQNSETIDVANLA